jgi:hypothetical protein
MNCLRVMYLLFLWYNQLIFSDLSYKLYVLERRQAEAARIREKYPDRIPVSYQSLLFYVHMS